MAFVLAAPATSALLRAPLACQVGLASLHTYSLHSAHRIHWALTVEASQQISQRFDLTHHRNCLTAVTAGDFADTLPTSAGGTILSHPHIEESKVLDRIIQEWNRHKGDWVSCNCRITKTSSDLGMCLRAAKITRKSAGQRATQAPQTLQRISTRPAVGKHRTLTRR